MLSLVYSPPFQFKTKLGALMDSECLYTLFYELQIQVVILIHY